MKTVAGLIVALLLGIGLLVWSFQRGESTGGSGPTTLAVYCAAGMKAPVSEIAERYREEFGVEIQLMYGGTSTLLSQLRVAERGDLFIAADDQAIQKAREAGVAREVVALCRQHPVIAVQSGNPMGVSSLEDLFRADLRVAVANPEAASIGKAARAAIGDRWDEFAAKVVVMKPTVTELAADLKLGAIDAAILWNSTVPQFAGTEAVPVPELTARAENVSVAVLESSAQAAAALKFARFLAAPQRGGSVFAEKHFITSDGDAWAERPELVLYSGGVNRPAVEQTLREFAEREGVEVTTVFNGCGILCASMKAMEDSAEPKFPDAYYACDLCFVPPVAAMFPESFLLTETEIGIAVQSGNPRAIRTLADLAQPNLKVGLCNAEQSTLGFMTAGMLKSSALDAGIRSNVVFEAPTADFLINQMRVGALDAVIVYKVNYQLQEEHLEFLPIEHEGARAVQPFAIRVDSEHRQLAGRLLECFRANRARFERSGFTWRGDEPPIKSAEIEIPPWLKPAATR